MSKTKKYTLLRPRKSDNRYGEKIIFRFIFNEQASFPGVVIDINSFNLKKNEEDQKAVDAANTIGVAVTDGPTELKYTIIKVPKKRNYGNLSDEDKVLFETEIRDVFLDVFSKFSKAIQTAKANLSPKTDEVKGA
jgi:hypothetical protein